MEDILYRIPSKSPRSLAVMKFLKMFKNRGGLFLLFIILSIGTSTLLRLALLVESAQQVDFTLQNLSGIFLWGLFYDFVSAVYAGIPLAIYLWFVPERIFSKPSHRFILYAIFFIASFLLLFNSAAEWFFWDEFNTRFNFIAVDYLIYTTEVIGNIYESYPVGWLLIVVAIVSILIVAGAKPWIIVSATTPVRFKARSVMAGVYAILLIAVFFETENQYHYFSRNAFVNELAGNGLYELFTAYRHNELDYERFYKGMDDRSAFTAIRKFVKTPEAEFVSSDVFSIERRIINHAPEKRLNVVLISVESFSADFMRHFGNEKAITPFLDSLAGHSLLFTNLYATGTRTVRGLEALSLCIPPTPGQSIVRRPGNENLFSVGKVFEEKGYKTEYIYGGYGYFDNMNYFFEHNGYDVVDRVALKDEEIDYENIWGVADENLFDLAMKEINKNAAQRPVFAHIMTTSNHRPFTYPDGRIDIPSHTSRAGAVKYTDFAIGRFIKQARQQPWFKNTIFVIVADHCASSAGKTELPVDKYHIPMLIYSPGNIEAGTMNRLMSQIDVGPTILGLLNFSYTSKFFGYDIFKLETGRERAFISTYQNLGFLTNEQLTILSPQFKSRSFSLSASLDLLPRTNSEHTDEAIVWYQAASYSFKHGLLK